MRRQLVATAVLTLVLVITTMVHAHEGHVHKVMGTVTSLRNNQLEVKTTDGKTVTVTLDSKTTIVRGTTKLDRTALKAGERVSVDATEAKKVMTAKAIKLGTAPPAKAGKQESR